MITVNNIKQLTLAALLLLLPSVAIAQNNEHALAKAVEEIVTSNDLNSKYVDEFVEEIYQKHGKKSAVLTSRIAKAFYMYSDDPTTKQRNFGRREPDTAMVYVNRAIAIDPKYPQPYIIAADIVKYEPSYGERDERLKKAMDWLNKGIAANPTDSSLYVKSAELLALTDVNAAVAKLNSLKERNPSFAVYRQLGRLYWAIYNNGGTTPFKEIVESYDKEDKNILNLGDLGAYMFSLYALCSVNMADWNKLYETGQYALGRFPDDYGLHMYYFYGCVRTNNWDAAITEYHKMEALAETPLLPIDHLRYGEALVGKKMYDEAIEKYQYILTLESATDDDKVTANNHIESAINEKTNDLVKLGEYNQALRVYGDFIQDRKSKGLLTASMLSMYAKIYQSEAEEQNGPEKEASMMKADKVYAEMQTAFPKFDDLAVYNRYIIHKSLDPAPDYPKGGIAKPFAEQLVSMLSNKSELTPYQQSRLTTAYWYLCYWNAVADKGNRKLAVEYANKILAIDPTFSKAQKIKDVFEKKKK